MTVLSMHRELPAGVSLCESKFGGEAPLFHLGFSTATATRPPAQALDASLVSLGEQCLDWNLQSVCNHLQLRIGDAAELSFDF